MRPTPIQVQPLDEETSCREKVRRWYAVPRVMHVDVRCPVQIGVLETERVREQVTAA